MIRNHLARFGVPFFVFNVPVPGEQQVQTARDREPERLATNGAGTETPQQACNRARSAGNADLRVRTNAFEQNEMWGHNPRYSTGRNGDNC